jgi:hypothetical protein
VELEGEWADLFREFEFDEVVDVFGLFVFGDVFEFGYGAKASFHLKEFFAGEDPDGFDGASVGDAGFDFVRKEAVVEGEGALPFLELFVEGLAEAA